MPVKRIISGVKKRATRAMRSSALWLRSRGWPAHSRLLLVGDGLKWSLSEDLKAIKTISLVSRGGVFYYPSEIYPEFGIKPFTEVPTVTGASE